MGSIGFDSAAGDVAAHPTAHGPAHPAAVVLPIGTDRSMRETPRILVATGDPVLLDEVLRLSAAASLDVTVVDSVTHVRASWTTAVLVIVGADLAVPLARVAPPRRGQVLLVGRSPLTPAMWQAAVGLGVDHVVELPEGERWLIDRLGDVGDGPRRNGRVICVVGGRGGAGASTLAAGIALTASSWGRSTLLVDADPWAGGLDVLLGAESESGLRWPDLVTARGRIAVSAFAPALPTVHGVSVVSWDRRPVSPNIEALTAIIDAGRRGFDLVVVDASRTFIPLPDTSEHIGPDGETLMPTVTLTAIDTVVLVVPTEVRAVTGAAQLLPRLRAAGADIRLAVRTLPTSMIGDVLVSEALGLPIAVRIDDDPAVTGSIDSGEPKLSGDRTSIGRAAADLLRSWGLGDGHVASSAA